MTRAYTVSKDPKSGMWYAHAKGYTSLRKHIKSQV